MGSGVQTTVLLNDFITSAMAIELLPLKNKSNSIARNTCPHSLHYLILDMALDHVYLYKCCTYSIHVSKFCSQLPGFHIPCGPSGQLIINAIRTPVQQRRKGECLHLCEISRRRSKSPLFCLFIILKPFLLSQIQERMRERDLYFIVTYKGCL